MSKHVGSDFDAFLEEDGLREDVTAAAVKRVGESLHYCTAGREDGASGAACEE
jgi:hypothetical protein